MTVFEGTFTALVTPFRDGALDEDALVALVETQIASGIDGLVPCGTTGESVTLVGDEHARVVRRVVHAARGRVPVVAGAGTASTRHSIELATIAKEAGADGVLLVCPYYNRPTQAGLEAHFRAILDAVSIPAMLYNIPARTGVDLAVDTLLRLADVPDIVAIKEATGDIMRSQEILSRAGDRFDVLSGDDSLSLGIVMAGGAGVVSVASNVAPREVVAATRAMRAGDAEQAQRRHAALQPLYRALFLESNPGPVKRALADLDRIAPEIRLPLVWSSDGTAQAIRDALEELRRGT